MTRLKAAAVGLAALFAATAADAAIVYNVDLDVGDYGNVAGTITTDGTIGVLTDASILDWDLVLTGDGASVALDSSNSDAFVVGTDTTADALHIYYNFGSVAASYFLFQRFPTFQGERYWCNSAIESACLSGVTVAPEHYTAASAQFSHPQGQQVIATAAVPEPAAWALMITGFGLAGAILRRRRAVPA